MTTVAASEIQERSVVVPGAVRSRVVPKKNSVDSSCPQMRGGARYVPAANWKVMNPPNTQITPLSKNLSLTKTTIYHSVVRHEEKAALPLKISAASGKTPPELVHVDLQRAKNQHRRDSEKFRNLNSTALEHWLSTLLLNNCTSFNCYCSA